MAITKTPRLDQTRWSSGQDIVQREDFDSDAAELDSIVVVYAEGPLISRPAAGVHGRFYTVVGDSTPANNGKQYYDNGSTWQAVSYANNLVTESVTATDTAFVARAAAGATANILEVQDSSGNKDLYVTPDGYISNQATFNTTGGVRFGYLPTHLSSSFVNSISANRPVEIIQGAASQSSNLLEFRNVGGTPIAYVDPTGSATFSGNLSAVNLTITGTLTAPGVNVAGSSSFNDISVGTTAVNTVPLSINSITSQTANAVEFHDPTGARVARFISDGTFATNGRVMVGNAQGNTGTQTFGATTAALTVRNSISSTTPVLNLYANTSGQTSRILQGFDPNGNMVFYFDGAGNGNVTSNFNTQTLAIGAGANTAPLSYYNNSNAPRFEVITGGATGTFKEFVTIRHPQNDTTTVSREVGIKLHLSSETNQTESNKFAGITASSTAANSAGPGLNFYSGGQNVGGFDSLGNLTLNGDVTVNGQNQLIFQAGTYDKIQLAGNNSWGRMGMQTGNTMYFRSDSFAFYSGGTQNPTSMNAGGGTTMLSFDNNRVSVPRISITQAPSSTSTNPPFMVGTDGHIQMNLNSIDSYGDAGNNTRQDLNLNTHSDGDIYLGSTISNVILNSRTLWIGGHNNHAVVFGGSGGGNKFDTWAGRPAQAGDWWFDGDNHQIGVNNGDHWLWFNPSNS